MDKGFIAEYDTPKNLLLNKNSIFYSLVKESGKTNEKKIFKTIFGN
jgi:ABC-type multidrug transport system fused ATPase/permease subunit